MIAIIADDFSGAAELAGIAAAHGLKAEVHTVFDPATDADVIAIDTDTRLQPERAATAKLRQITQQLMAAKPSWIYKKTDSVLRGHVRAEIETILDVTGFTHCVLFPANPSKGRFIRDGHYFLADQPLHETHFAHDPDHPRSTSDVIQLLGSSQRIDLPDATTLDAMDLSLPHNTLAAGAADFFAVRLKTWHPFEPQSLQPPPAARLPRRVLVLCGSLAAWQTGRAEQLQAEGFEIKTLAEPVSAAVWQSTSKLLLAIGHAKGLDTAHLTQQLISKALPLLKDPKSLRLGLEGGTTALAFIQRMGWTRFETIPEHHSGIGILRTPNGMVLCVKPGSYLWPPSCLPHQSDSDHPS